LLDPSHTRLAEPCVLGDGANLLHLSLDVVGHELAVSTDTPVPVNTVVGLADSAEALGDLRALLRQALMLPAGHSECLPGWHTAHERLWRVFRTDWWRLVACGFRMRLHLIERLLCLGDDFLGGAHFGRHRGTDGLAELMLPMEQVR
jgi:hypothetical protein